jgi:hypothetical protein
MLILFWKNYKSFEKYFEKIYKKIQIHFKKFKGVWDLKVGRDPNIKDKVFQIQAS